jgi:phage tail sheath protein FI
MAFSLSPSVAVKEFDNSQYIANLPSSKTGMVVCSDTGPCNRITPITNESDLINWFGKPTAANYQDWFQAWNFLQYSASLYVSRPMNTTVKNAGIKLSGSTAESTALADLYNTEKAELTLQNDNNFQSSRLYFYNRFITSTQKVGVAVCSSSTYWKAPIANEFVGIIPSDATNIATIGNFGGLSSTASTTINLALGGTLAAGSQFLTNDITPKVVTVKNVYDAKVVVDTAVKAEQLALYVGTVKTGLTSGNVSTTGLVFDGTKTFTLQKFSILTLGANAFYVTSIDVNTNGVDYDVKFAFVPGGASANTGVTVGVGVLYSNTDYFKAAISSDYYGTPAATGDYFIPAGSVTIKVDAGFNFPVGAVLKFTKSGSEYNGLVSDAFPSETGVAADSYQIVGVDALNNVITLDIPLIHPFKTTGSTQPVLDDVNVNLVGLKGINMLSTIYDDSMIRKVKVNAVDASGSTEKNVVVTVESLPNFSNFLDYEPNWVADEFVTVVLVKNAAGKFAVAETKLASYNPTARDTQGRNLYANEVFFYGSKYVFARVGTDETLNKAETATSGIAKFVSTLGSTTAYETVYPLDTTGVKYDATNYTKADCQNAFAVFADAEIFDVNILVANKLDINGASEIAESRKDCIAIIAPFEYAALVGQGPTAATDYLLQAFGTQTPSDSKIFTTNGTYSALYGNMKYQYDKFNDVNRWICVAGDVAGIYAQTDKNRDPWWAPAGMDRGKIKNVIKLAFNANKQNRDDLYVNAINPIITIAGEGAGIIFGQKTATAKPSALDRINVRRLLIVIEKAIASAVKYSIFEFNDSFTRNRIVGMIEPFLRTVKARRGLYSYGVQCDAANNPPAVIDQNGLVIDIFVQPTKVAEFIEVRVNIMKTGDVGFSEKLG